MLPFLGTQDMMVFGSGPSRRHTNWLCVFDRVHLKQHKTRLSFHPNIKYSEETQVAMSDLPSVALLFSTSCLARQCHCKHSVTCWCVTVFHSSAVLCNTCEGGLFTIMGPLLTRELTTDSLSKNSKTRMCRHIQKAVECRFNTLNQLQTFYQLNLLWSNEVIDHETAHQSIVQLVCSFWEWGPKKWL